MYISLFYLFLNQKIALTFTDYNLYASIVLYSQYKHNTLSLKLLHTGNKEKY